MEKKSGSGNYLETLVPTTCLLESCKRNKRGIFELCASVHPCEKLSPLRRKCLKCRKCGPCRPNAGLKKKLILRKMQANLHVKQITQEGEREERKRRESRNEWKQLLFFFSKWVSSKYTTNPWRVAASDLIELSSANDRSTRRSLS